MKRAWSAFLLSFFLLGASSPAGQEELRDFQLSWTVTVESVPAEAKNVQVWIAIPQDLPEQTVADLEVETDHPWEYVEDPDFRNKMVHLIVEGPPASFTVGVSARVCRRAVSAPRPAVLDAEQRELFLREEALVSLSPRIRALAERAGKDGRDRYEYVLSHMEYDKSVPGYGEGDSERACDVGKGNCTDFHSLFMSLSRASGVPAVFEMGYPTKPEGETGKTGGYHCWAWFYENGAWVAVDISEADKAPEKADFFFGNLDPDRITFSRGRDVVLPGMKGEPLNYLPPGAYVEVDGRPHSGVARSITYTVSHPSSG